MNSGIVVWMALCGVAAADPLPDPKVIPMPDDVKDVCVVTRSIRPVGYASGIEVASGKDGEVTRRGLWTFQDGKVKRADYLVTNQWTNGRLTKSERVGGESTTFAYDQSGRPTEIKSGNDVTTYAWKVTPVAKATLVDATREAPDTRLARWLPFKGTVDVTVNGGRARTYTYDAHGVLQDPQCTGTTRGRPTTCQYEGRHKVVYRWSDNKLTQRLDEPPADENHPKARSSYQYGADGRIIDILDEESMDGKTWKQSGHTTIEYRCKSTYIVDEDARWPR